MATEPRHSGTLRTDMEANLARLGDLPVMENDRDRLLHRLVQGSKGTVHSLLENHVLTVLADIRRKRLKGYPDTFADSQGTAEAERYAEKLRKDIEGWVERLNTYADRCWKSGCTGSAVKVAQELSDRLKAAQTGTGKEGWYRMFRTVSAIQEESDRYLRQAEESGDTEPSFALLIAYLKNYAGIAKAFNHRLASLPELYLKEILHAEPKAAEPDNAYVIITPTETAGGFTLAEGTAFPAGEEMTYRTGKPEYISPCAARRYTPSIGKAIHCSNIPCYSTVKHSPPIPCSLPDSPCTSAGKSNPPCWPSVKERMKFASVFVSLPTAYSPTTSRKMPSPCNSAGKRAGRNSPAGALSKVLYSASLSRRIRQMPPPQPAQKKYTA